MVDVTREISKEFYDQCVSKSKKDSREAVEKYLGMAITAGYGLYGYNFYEKDGKYYLKFTRGSSCD